MRSGAGIHKQVGSESEVLERLSEEVVQGLRKGKTTGTRSDLPPLSLSLSTLLGSALGRPG